MGDFAPPKRKDVFDRLRRRLELYRRHQNCSATRYDNGINTIYEHQGQDTLIHRQRWLESKAKKQSKQKPKDHSTSHGSAERNPVLNQRIKRKIDGTQVENQEPAETNDPCGVPGNPAYNVTVSIEQPKNSTLKVNVRTSLDTSKEALNSIETTTSVECKREPQDEASDSDGGHASEILPQDELDALLASIQGKDESLDEDQLIDELKRFDEIYRSKFSEDSEVRYEDKMYQGMTNPSPGLQKSAPPGFEPNSPFDGTPSYPVRSPPVSDYRSTPSSSLADSGPAAQTLKQMAAQHQNLHSTGFPAKDVDPYGSNIRSNAYPGSQNNGFQSYEQTPYPASRDQYLPSQNMNNMQHMSYPPNKTDTDPSLTYNGTKPLTHYQPQPPPSGIPPSQQPPSSLQQLQDQVAHFNPNQQMQITQTQHMQVSDGAHRMQLTQTQLLQMRQAPQQISMSQKQTISMPGTNMGPNLQPTQYPANDHMKNQMLHEKMRRERQAQARSLLEEQHQMQQYMNRPPPEYKMQHSAPEGYHPSSMGPNPLQTMQNMVNSTNTMQQTQYGPINSENSQMTMQNSMMQSQMVTMQRMNSAGGQTPDMVAPGGQGFPSQSLQRQQSFPGAMMNAPQARPTRPPEPTYTSTIMRNQRPPNVNVGPDGLNISQPRSHNEWPRPMGPGQTARPQHPTALPTTMSSGMMQYHYGNQNGMASAQMQGMQMRQQRPNMQMASMHSQAAMMQNNVQAPVMMQGTAQAQQQQQQIMMQQQNLQISQRSMGARSSGQMTGMVANSPMRTGTSQPDDIMNLLDSAAQGNNSDLMDGITGTSADGNHESAWLDEFLGGK